MRDLEYNAKPLVEKKYKGKQIAVVLGIKLKTHFKQHSHLREDSFRLLDSFLLQKTGPLFSSLT
jgi:hypothetical protein